MIFYHVSEHKIIKNKKVTLIERIKISMKKCRRILEYVFFYVYNEFLKHIEKLCNSILVNYSI